MYNRIIVLYSRNQHIVNQLYFNFILLFFLYFNFKTSLKKEHIKNYTQHTHNSTDKNQLSAILGWGCDDLLTRRIYRTQKSYYTHGYTLLQQKDTFKISKGEMCAGGVQEGPSSRFQLLSPRDVVQTVLKLPARTCDNIRSAANHKSSLKPRGARAFTGALCAHVTDLSYLSPASPEGLRHEKLCISP